MEDEKVNPLSFLDLSEDDLKESLEQVARYGNRDGRICVCGHSMK